MGRKLVIDGADLEGEYADFICATPVMVHEIPDGRPAVSRVLGPVGFTITIADPSDRLYAMADGGKAVHTVKVIADGYSITHATRFHKGWVGSDGTRQMFGSLALARERAATWVHEPKLAEA